MFESKRGVWIVAKSSLLGFFDPAWVIAIAVKDDSLVLFDGLFDELMDGGWNVFRGIKDIGELLKLLR